MPLTWRFGSPSKVPINDADRDAHRGAGGIVFALALLSALITIIPLAYAVPPDPIWIPGVYDLTDEDRSVSILTEAKGASRASPLARPTDGLERCGLPRNLWQIPSGVSRAEMIRGPPRLAARSRHSRTRLCCPRRPPPAYPPIGHRDGRDPRKRRTCPRQGGQNGNQSDRPAKDGAVCPQGA